MSEERLKEIKDSLDTPVWILTQRTFAKSYMEIHLQQELELYNEVVRLREIIKNYEQPLIFLQNRINQGMSNELQNQNAILYVKDRLNNLKEKKNEK